jgi:hypothetical protein
MRLGYIGAIFSQTHLVTLKLDAGNEGKKVVLNFNSDLIALCMYLRGKT